MKYLFWGIIIGLLLNPLLLFWQVEGGIEIYPQWHGKIDSIRNIERSNVSNLARIKLPPIKTQSVVFILSGNGYILTKADISNPLIAISGNGEYLVKYEKVGSNIEFLNIRGESFWKIESREYPFLSFNGKINLLMSSDHNRIRIVDYNGIEIGARGITGRFCTVISFSKYSDFACIGFLDGSYYLVDEWGEILSQGVVPGSLLIKGMAVNFTGNFFAIHYGNNERDFLRLVNLRGNEIYTIPMQNVHLTKSAMNVSNSGNVSIIDYDRILLIGEKGKPHNIINIHPKRAGTSVIECTDDVCVASYTGTNGKAQFLIFRNDGTLLFAREFPEESFLDSFIEDSIVLLRGSQGLYCYNLTRQYIQ